MVASFSHSVKEIISLSRNEAERLGNSKIDLEHLVLAMLLEGNNPAVSKLTVLGVEQQKVKAAMEAAAAASPFTGEVSGKVPLSKEAERSLKNCYLEARTLKATEIAADHLLLAILREKNHAAVKALNAFQLSYENLRDTYPPVEIC